MERLTLKEVVRAVGGKLIRGDGGSDSDGVTGVSTDTRTLQPGDFFFALQGERSDGHEYLRRAFEAGAGGAVISKEEALPPGVEKPVIKVPDVLWALGELAKYYRGKFDVQVIGVTGSVGKTTTKEMLASILERKWKVLKNAMNFNNEIGVPLTLFQLERSHHFVVLEMAMRGLGEIRRLAQIAQPSVGVITNVGITHIGRLGSQGAIADAKSELLQELPPDGLAVLNAEDGYFTLMKDRFGGRVISFGSCKDADVIGTQIKQSKDGRCRVVILVQGGAIRVSMPILGYYNAYNALAAAAAAVGLGADLSTIRDGLESFARPVMRMELVKSRWGYVILNDAYNASPASTLAALKTLQSLAGYKRKIAVLGDMLELGDYAPMAHRDIGRAAVDCGVGMLVVVGKLAAGIAEGAKSAGFPERNVRLYPDSIQAAKRLKTQVTDGDAVLVKGSRAMNMEEIVRVLLSE